MRRVRTQAVQDGGDMVRHAGDACDRSKVPFMWDAELHHDRQAEQRQWKGGNEVRREYAIKELSKPRRGRRRKDGNKRQAGK